MPAQTDVRTADNSTDTEYHLGSYGVPRLGVDNKDRAHYFDEANDRMLVVRDDGSVSAYPLDGRPVVEWVAYIAEKKCGWQTHGTSQLIDALAGAINPGEAE